MFHKNTKIEEPLESVKSIIKKTMKEYKIQARYRRHLVLATAHLIIKPDAVRFRTIGNYSQVSYRKLLQYGNRGQYAILYLSGLTHCILTNPLTVKESIRLFDSHCTLKHYTIHKAHFDVKTFYTDIIKKQLVYIVDSIARRYRTKHKTTYVTFTHPNRSKPTYHVGKQYARDNNYITLDIHTITNYLKLAINNSYFTIGEHVFFQKEGIPIG
jgi:hypothetical protein